MAIYVDKASVKAEFDALHFTEGLDDDRSGTEDTNLFETLAREIDKRIQGVVSVVTQRGQPAPAPQFLKNCGCDLMCALIFRRRDVPNDQNPFYEREKAALKHLDDLADGTVRTEKQTLKIFAVGNPVGTCFGLVGEQ